MNSVNRARIIRKPDITEYNVVSDSFFDEAIHLHKSAKPIKKKTEKPVLTHVGAIKFFSGIIHAVTVLIIHNKMMSNSPSPTYLLTVFLTSIILFLYTDTYKVLFDFYKSSTHIKSVQTILGFVYNLPML